MNVGVLGHKVPSKMIIGRVMKRKTVYSAELINTVMTDLRSYGAKCVLLTNPQEDIVIRASFPDGKLWEITDIEDDYIIKKYRD